MIATRRSTLALRALALVYVLGLLAVPILVILYRTFEPGVGAFFDSIRTVSYTHLTLPTSDLV